MSGRKPLFNRDFVLLWQGQFVSLIGSQAFTVAMMFWVKRATGSATLMGLIMMGAMLPMVLLSPLGGTLADRVSRKRIIVFSDVVNGLAVLSLALLMFLAPDATGTIVAWLVVVAVTSGILQSFFGPAIAASIPNIVAEERVAAANSLTEGSVQLATLVGQGIGGVLFRVLGAPVLFLIDGFSYLFSALSESLITIPQEKAPATQGWREAQAHFRRDLAEGLSFVWRHEGLRSLMVVAAVMNFFAMPLIVLLPFHVEDILGAGPDWFGYLLAGYGAGGVVGYAIAGTVGARGRRRMTAMLFSLVVESLALVLLGLAGSVTHALGVLVGAGIFSGAFNVWLMTILQTSTPDRYRGRVFGVLHTVVLGLTLISMACAGIVADLLDRNTRLLFVVCGLVLVLTSFLAAASRPLRAYLSYESRDNEDENPPRAERGDL